MDTTAAVRAHRRKRRLPARAVLFTAVGVGATVLNAVCYVLLRAALSAGAANVLALLLSTAASSAAQRYLVFSDRRTRTLRMHLQTAGVFAYYCASNSLALWVLGVFVPRPSSAAEAVAVSVASVFGGISRFAVLSTWVFRRDSGAAFDPACRAG